MWRRGFSRRRGAGTGIGGGRYSFATVVLFVSLAILVILYLTGRLNI